MPPEEARQAALPKLGNRTRIREDIYHMNTSGTLETLSRDVRYSLSHTSVIQRASASAGSDATTQLNPASPVCRRRGALRVRLVVLESYRSC